MLSVITRKSNDSKSQTNKKYIYLKIIKHCRILRGRGQPCGACGWLLCFHSLGGVAHSCSITATVPRLTQGEVNGNSWCHCKADLI